MSTMFLIACSYRCSGSSWHWNRTKHWLHLEIIINNMIMTKNHLSLTCRLNWAHTRLRWTKERGFITHKKPIE